MRQETSTSLAGVAGCLVLLFGGCSGGGDSPTLSAQLKAARVSFVGHQELIVAAGREPIPLVFDNPDVGVCFQAASDIDTSRWKGELRLDGSLSKDGAKPPTRRLGSTLCFLRELPQVKADEEAELCVTIIDEFRNQRAALPCIGFRRSVMPEDFKVIADELSTPASSVPKQESLLDRIPRERYPMLYVRAQQALCDAAAQSGSNENLARGAEILRHPPHWLDSPSADFRGAGWEYARAKLEIAWGRDMSSAWMSAGLAARRYRSVAHALCLAAALMQARILARSGDLDGACALVRQGLQDLPAGLTRDDAKVRAARTYLGWWLLMRPAHRAQDIAEAKQHFDDVLLTPKLPSRERANLLINVAYAAAYSNDTAAGSLAEASVLLEQETENSEFLRYLNGWKDVVIAMQAQIHGDTNQALRIYVNLAADESQPELAAAGASGAAEIYRQRGMWPHAREAVSEAISLERMLAPDDSAMKPAVTAGQRAVDLYQAVRIALDGNDPTLLLSVLAELDRLDTISSFDWGSTPVEAARWRAAQQRLSALDGPASTARQEQRESQRREIRHELQDLLRLSRRQWRGTTVTPSPPQFRAIPLSDEVLVLRSLSPSMVTLYRRTPIKLSSLESLIERVNEEMSKQALDNKSWCQLVAPLAAALVPAREDLKPVTTFALHGSLQGIPLAALGLPGSRNCESFLADATVVSTWMPEASVDRPLDLSAGLAVIDPTGDLPSESRTVAVLKESGLDLRAVVGEGATRHAVLEALANAHWVHIDAHTLFDPSSPELSSVELADSSLLMPDLVSAASKISFANLSSCNSSRSPPTAGVGRFGIAGALRQKGVGSVVAARWELADTLGIDFNQAFYSNLATSRSVYPAFRAALGAVRQKYKATQWGGLMILGSEENSGFAAENSPPRTTR